MLKKELFGRRAKENNQNTITADMQGRQFKNIIFGLFGIS